MTRLLTPKPTNKNITARGLTLLSITVAAAALLTGCQSGSDGPQVTTDFNPQANFAQYRTFAFQKGRIVSRLGTNDANNTLVDTRIRDAVLTALPEKGLQPVTQNPDFVVTYIAGAQNKKEVEDLGPEPYDGPYFGRGFGFRPYGAWYGAGYDRFYVKNYTQGTLILDFVDPRTKQLFWRAYVTADIGSGPVTEKQVQSAVEAALKNYPPKPKG